MLVWAYAELKELNKETGFVLVDDKLAEKLIKEKKVQMANIGALNLKPIGAKLPVKRKASNVTSK